MKKLSSFKFGLLVLAVLVFLVMLFCVFFHPVVPKVDDFPNHSEIRTI